MFGFLRAIDDWCKYDRLNYYPPLQKFPKDEALKRLLQYEKEEREACEPWYSFFRWGTYAAVWIGGLIVVGIWIWFIWYTRGNVLFPVLSLVFCSFIFVVPNVFICFLFTYVMHRRIRRRVKEKIAAELNGGRLWTCGECGYDLRASHGDNCPECGAAIRVAGES